MRNYNSVAENKLKALKQGAARRPRPVHWEEADEEHFLTLLRIGKCTYCAYEPAEEHVEVFLTLYLDYVVGDDT